MIRPSSLADDRPARGVTALVSGLAVAFLLAHLPFLPSSLEDIDSVNFALGVRHFDVSQHRPHPPGYPVYIALAKVAVGAASILDPAAARPESRSRLEGRAMAAVSLGGGLVAVVLLYRLFACFGRADSDRLGRPWRTLDVRALAATALAIACPLFWYMSARPMSDVPGFAAALAALVCLALAWWRQQPGVNGERRLDPSRMAASGRMIVLGSLFAGVAIGFRSQNAVLTVPFLLAVLLDRLGRGAAGAILGGGVAFTVGGLLWGIPLVVASGGLNAYLAALGTQAGEDFAGVEMLYLNPSPRLAAIALVRTFVDPWDSVWLGAVVLILAAAGLGALVVRERRTLMALIAIGAPYLMFHLLFQDMDFVRYALPIVPVVAFLAVCGLEAVAPRAALAAAGAIVLWGVAVAAPVLRAYAAEPSPVVRVLDAMRAEMPSGERVVLAMHQTFQRPLEAEAVPLEERLASPPRREWLELVRYWRDGNVAPIWFLADPRRTDLALVDPRSRGDHRDFGWRFSSRSQIGGMRPAAVNWYRLAPPGWFADEGWALTPETAGIARSMEKGPSIAPIRAYVRRRAGATRLLVGGRHLGTSRDEPAAFAAAIDGRPVAAWSTRAGFFLKLFGLPAGALAGPGPLAELTIAATSRGTGAVPTAVEQFDLQAADALMWGFADGWHESEYNPRIGLWRWTSERAALLIAGAAAPVAVRIQIERPLRYFDAAPAVRLTAAGRVLAEAHPEDDAVIETVVTPDVLRASGGLVFVETDKTFVPAERGGGGDVRHLGLRVFGVSIAYPN